MDKHIAGMLFQFLLTHLRRMTRAELLRLLDPMNAFVTAEVGDNLILAISDDHQDARASPRRKQARRIYSSIGWPQTSCSALGRFDFIRVLLARGQHDRSQAHGTDLRGLATND